MEFKINLKLYYAHPKWIYYTNDEEETIKLIKKILGKHVYILNPRDYDEDPDFAKLKRTKGMDVCFKLIDQTDCVIFQRFFISEQFKNYILEYLQNADEYGCYKSRLGVGLRDLPLKLQQLVTDKESLITPGVAEEVNYALKSKKQVYEVLLTEKQLNIWKEKLQSDFQGPYDPLYQTLNLFLKAYRDNSPKRLFPPFWWLTQK